MNGYGTANNIMFSLNFISGYSELSKRSLESEIFKGELARLNQNFQGIIGLFKPELSRDNRTV